MRKVKPKKPTQHGQLRKHEKERAGTANLPIHFRIWGDYQRDNGSFKSWTMCGMRPGRPTWGAYDVTWSRVTAKFHQTTCQECLAIMAVRTEKMLAARLAATGGTREQALEDATNRLTVVGLQRLVNA